MIDETTTPTPAEGETTEAPVTPEMPVTEGAEGDDAETTEAAE